MRLALLHAKFAIIFLTFAMNFVIIVKFVNVHKRLKY